MTIDLELQEELADYAHQAWSGWMRYLFSNCQDNGNGTMTIPAWAVERWKRQMNTPYSDLPQEEKESDRYEAGILINRIWNQDINCFSGTATVEKAE